LAQAGRDRLYSGTISRGFESNDNPVVRGKIKVLDGFILTVFLINHNVLGSRLDELISMRWLGWYWVTNILLNFRKDKSYKIIIRLSLHLHIAGVKTNRYN